MGIRAKGLLASCTLLCAVWLLGAVLPVLGERLGDQRAQVRSACLELLLDMMKVTGSVQVS